MDEDKGQAILGSTLGVGVVVVQFVVVHFDVGHVECVSGMDGGV